MPSMAILARSPPYATISMLQADSKQWEHLLTSRSALWDAKQKAAWKPIWQALFYAKWDSNHDFYAKNAETRHSAD